MLSSATSPSSSRRFESSDPYSSAIVDDLLNGVADWRSVQDVVRLTLKALSDVVKSQGTAIRDLERQLPQKLSKSEAQTQLSQKVSSSELAGHLADIQAVIESRGPLMDLQAQLEQKVSRSDLSFLLGSRPTVDEVKTLMEGKVTSREMDAATQMLLSKLEDSTKDLSRRISTCAQERDFRALESVLQEKANQSDVEEALNDKAGKQMVSTALSRKANLSDVEVMLSSKAERTDLESILGILDGKAEGRWVEQLVAQVETKAEAADFAAVAEELTSKASKRELDGLHSSILAEIRDISQQLAAHLSSLDDQTASLTSEIDRVRTSLLTAINKKVENRDMDKWMAMLSKKADEEKIVDLLRLHKGEIGELVGAVKSESRADRQSYEAKTMEKTGKVEVEVREIVNETGRLKAELADLVDLHRREQDDQAKYIKSLNSSLKFELNTDLTTLRDQVDALTKGLTTLSKDRASVSDLGEVKNTLLAALSARASADTVHSSISEAKADLGSTVQSLREETKQRISRLENELLEAMEKKAGIELIQGSLEDKADSAMVTRLCGLKASVEDFEDLRRTVDAVRVDMQRRASQTDLELHVAHTRSALEEAAKDIVMKANIKDVCTLLDMKASNCH